MVNQMEALDMLNKEKAYEDKLSNDLSQYLLYSLDSMKDVSDREKELVKEGLRTIMFETMKHSRMFNEMIMWVVDNAEDSY